MAPKKPESQDEVDESDLIERAKAASAPESKEVSEADVISRAQQSRVPVSVEGDSRAATTSVGGLTVPAQRAPPRDPGLWRTLGRNALSGFFKQGSDEAVGAIAEHATDLGPNAFYTLPSGERRAVPARSDLYRAVRDGEREILEGAQEHRPKTAFLANMAGDIASDAALQALGVPASSTAYQVATGALSGLLGSDADISEGKATPENVASAAGSTVLGGGLGYVMPKVGNQVGKRLPAAMAKLQEKMRQVAETRAVKAVTGQNQRALQSLIDKGSLNEVGRDLLDHGVVTAGADVATVRNRAAALAEQEGKKIGKALDEVDALIPDDARPWKYDVAQDVERRMVKPRENMSGGDLPVAKRLQREADQVRAHNFPNRPTLSRLEQQKRYLDQFIDFEGAEPPVTQEALRDLRDYLSNNVEQEAWRAAQAVGSDAAERFLAAKRLYGSMESVAGPGLKQQTRELSNRLVSASDYGLGVGSALAAATAGGASLPAALAAGVGGTLGNKFLRERGNQVAAAGLDAASKSRLVRALAAAGEDSAGRAVAQGVGATSRQVPTWDAVQSRVGGAARSLFMTKEEAELEQQRVLAALLHQRP